MLTSSKIRAAIAAIFMIGAAPATFAQEFTLSFHQFQPAGALMPTQIFKPWMDRIATASNGRLKIEMVSGPDAAGNAAQLIGLAEDGTIDIAMSLTGYTPGRFIRSEVFELPFMMRDTAGTSLAFQKLIEEDFQHNEYASMKVLSGWVHSPGQFHTKRPITTLSDVAGQVLRSPTRIIGNLMTELGATPVNMPLPATRKALQDGTIEGSVLTWQVSPSLGLADLVANHTEFEGEESLYTATLVMVMNLDKFNSLPKDLQDILVSESGAKLSREAGQIMEDNDAAGRDIAVAKGNTIHSISESEISLWKAAAANVQITWADEAAISGIDGWDLLDYARETIAEMSTQGPS
jgi:TRAP-type C4-dicarboxylate transport system substrate-binding protein